MNTDDGMPAADYFAQPRTIDTSPGEVLRAVRYMEAWLALPAARASIGSGTVASVEVLMQFARDTVTEETDVEWAP